MLSLLILILLTCLATAGCRKTMVCNNTTAGFRIHGFTNDEIATVSFRAYRAHTGFSVPVDTFTFRLGASTGSFQNNILDLDGVLSTTDSADWMIVLPAAGRSFRVTEITAEPIHSETYIPSGKKYYACINDYLTYKVNDSLKRFEGPGFVIELYK